MASPSYQLTHGAADDLHSIARYTVQTWGIEQARNYEEQLKTCFEQIASGQVQARHPIPRRKDLLHARCQSHHIFYMAKANQPPLIIAVLHERMDLINRLKSRLS